MRGLPRQFYKSIMLLTAVFGFVLIGHTAYVSAIARGYTTSDNGIQNGMVVSLNFGESTDVERATQNNKSLIIGIVTTVDNSLVTVSSGTASVLVESEGQVDAYVSDINGQVENGDLLIMSPLKGIMMRAPDNTSLKVIAVAIQPATESETYQFDGKNNLTDTKISKIRVDLSYLGAGNSGVIKNNSALAKLGKSVIGRDVSETRVIIALIIFVIVLIAEGGILYGAMSSALTSLGRNPLAGKFIRSELIRIISVALAVLVIGLSAVYAVLWV